MLVFKLSEVVAIYDTVLLGPSEQERLIADFKALCLSVIGERVEVVE